MEIEETVDLSLNAFVRSQIGRDVLRKYMDDIGKTVTDPTVYAQALYDKKIVTRTALDLATERNFPDENRQTTFLSTMYHSMDLNPEHFFLMIEVLKTFPTSVEVAEKMLREYDELLVKYEFHRFAEQPPVVQTLEEAEEEFRKLDVLFEELWEHTITIVRNEIPFEDLKRHMTYSFIDNRDKVKAMEEMEPLLTLARSRIDPMNVALVEALCMESHHLIMTAKVYEYFRERMLIYNKVLIKHMKVIVSKPGYLITKPDAGESVVMKVNWDVDKATVADYYWLMDAAFSSLTKHFFLEKIDLTDFSFHLTSAKWIALALSKLSRERTYVLRNHGIVTLTVGIEMVVYDINWGLTDEDKFEFMEHMLKVVKGKLSEVAKDIEGIPERRMKRALKQGVKQFTLNDFSVAHCTFRLTDFSHHLHLNDLWVSPPFYSGHPGYKFCLGVNCNGVGMGRGTHISVCACLMKGEYDDQLEWPFRGRVTIRMCNQLVPMSHIVGMFEFDEFIRQDTCNRVTGPTDFAPIGLGSHMFASHADLEYDVLRNTQFIKQDYIELEVCDVRVGPPNY